jgi:apolipoprotein N-acyltransferase
MDGATPFLRFGNAPAVIAAALLFILGVAVARTQSARNVLK